MNRAEAARNSYLALVHYPVYDRHRRVVATSITNLDIHDIARSSRTYELAGYFLVHPVEAQRELAARIVRDWGNWLPEQAELQRDQSDHRREALSRVRVAASLDESIAQIEKEHGKPPLIVATSARPVGQAVGAIQLLHEQAQTQQPLLLVFGTGWGLTEDVVARTDRSLQPIFGPLGPGGYNHLSVRSAAGIILDRLFGRPELVSGENRP